MANKLLIAIADGLGDRPINALQNKTPLQFAKTPYLDQLAKEGVTGMMYPIGPGIPVGTDMGHLVLFGNHPSVYPGRGPIEAAGEGMDLQEGDIAFRCNFSTRIDNNVILDRRAGRIREGTKLLEQAIHNMHIEDVTVLFKAATEHRAVLILRGEGLSEQVSDTDPHAPNDGHPFHEAKPLDNSKEAMKTARILNILLEKIYQTLKVHPVNIERQNNNLLPANFIITRGAGKMTKLKPFTEQLNFKGAIIAGESTVLGIGRMSGLTPITKSSLTGNMDTNIKEKAQLAIDALKENDVVYVHIKAPDIQGHDNQPHQKAKAIELFDTLVHDIHKKTREQVYIALAADHSTPCARREHSGEAVPVLIHGSGIRTDHVTTFDEIACATGGLSTLTGNEFISLLLDYIEKTVKLGN